MAADRRRRKSALGRARAALADRWLAWRDPLAHARKHHRETLHARQRRKLARYIPPGGVGVEVGVFWAHFAEILVRKFQPSRLHLVDPWDRLHGEHFRFATPYSLDGQLTTAQAMQAALDLAARHPDVVSVHKEFGHEFFARFPDNTFDWVYLDAAHDRASVLADLETILPKLKPTGILFGDDYFEDPEAKHAGVKQAVDEFAAVRDLELIVERPYQYILLQSHSPRPQS